MAAERISTKIHQDAWDRIRALSDALGMSGINTLRALSYATPEECAECEKRRLAAVAGPTGRKNDAK